MFFLPALAAIDIPRHLRYMKHSSIPLIKESSGAKSFDTYTPTVTKGEYVDIVGSNRSDAHKNGYDGSTYGHL